MLGYVGAASMGQRRLPQSVFCQSPHLVLNEAYDFLGKCCSSRHAPIVPIVPIGGKLPGCWTIVLCQRFKLADSWTTCWADQDLMKQKMTRTTRRRMQ